MVRDFYTVLHTAWKRFERNDQTGRSSEHNNPDRRVTGTLRCVRKKRDKLVFRSTEKSKSDTCRRAIGIIVIETLAICYSCECRKRSSRNRFIRAINFAFIVVLQILLDYEPLCFKICDGISLWHSQWPWHPDLRGYSVRIDRSKILYYLFL